MRYALAMVAVVLLGTSFTHSANAQSPLVRTVARHVTMQDFEVDDFKYQCPAGYMPISYSFTPQYPYDLWEERDRTLIDRSGSGVSKTSLSSAAQIDGGGVALTMDNVEHHAKQWEAFITCLAITASSDNTFAFPSGSVSTPKLSTGVANAFCPADFPVAMSGFSNGNGLTLKDVGSAPLWGTSASPVTLGSVADGTTGPPTGWQVKVYNTSFSASVSAVAVAV